MADKVTYSCTALMGTNKAGTLKPDADGYYTVVLGALDIYNSAGAFYDYDSAKELFKEGSSLMRRIKNAALRGEYGHPKMTPGMTQRDFMKRICEIYEDKVAFHIAEITIDYTTVKNEQGQPVITIIGKILPSGPFGDILKAQLDNPKENVCFSIRSLTDDVVQGGKWFKHLKIVVTWDYVNEPGIALANKWKSPALEQFSEMTFHLDQVRAVASAQVPCGMGMESDSLLKQVVEVFAAKAVSKPASLGW